MHTIVLKPGKERTLRRRHPWVFSGAIQKMDQGIAEGDLVTVVDSRKQFLAVGHYQIGSITVRVLAFEPCRIGPEFWQERFTRAWQRRHTFVLKPDSDTNVFRLINAEGDDLPGLIVDYYGGTAVVQTHSVGMYGARQEIAAALRAVLGDQLTGIYDKSAATLPYKAPVTAEDGWLWGGAQSNVVRENGLQFEVDWAAGQKTGFFIDQRENRQLLATLARDRRVLNMFGYTGGFSLYALQGGARRVDTVESSAPAVELLCRNVALNFPDRIDTHRAIATDGFKYLDSMGRDYDLIVLDPPAFAKHLKVVTNALKGYTRINTSAMARIAPGGILFTFSCSQVVDRKAFRQSVFTAAARTGRPVRILHQLTQPADHPVSIYHPEGEYLKGLVVQVD